MYHPTRGGVRGGRDQFSWDDVKVDKHRENYLGHSIKAPVGRWQKGKDLHWYTRDKSSKDMQAVKDEVKLIKEQEEQAMREALGLAPKRASHRQGNRLDKHEFSELVKRGSTAEDVSEGHAEAARVQGLGFLRTPREWEESGSAQQSLKEVSSERAMAPVPMPDPSATNDNEKPEDESSRKRRREEKKREKREKHEKREKRHARDSDDKRTRKRDKERRRHDSD